MTIQTILVPLYGNGEDATCLGAAADIARRMLANITALYCEEDPTERLYLLVGQEATAYFPDSLVKALQERAEARRGAAQRSFSEWLSSSNLPFADSPAASRVAAAHLTVAPGRLQNVVRDYAVVADLVIVPLSQQRDPDRSIILETALFDAGRPVFAVPPSAKSTIFAGPVAIAWNYSSEAARALSAALPLIGAAGEAVVLMAGQHEDNEAAKRVVAFLAWHGVKARAIKLGQGGKVAELIAAKVRELGAGLLVMGAYSHTRAREFVFGGLTSYMLEKAPVPLLLAH